MRGRVFNVPAIARAAGCVVVAAAILAAALQFNRNGLPPPVTQLDAPSHVDPLAAAMAHCQTLGMAAENDAACQAAWAENHRRFFNDSPAPESR
jgi:conjugative transfer region protein TrbK